MRYRILPYKQGSKGAKALATALGGKVLKLAGSNYVQNSDDIVVNWGNTNMSALPDMWLNAAPGQYRVLNRPSAIRAASNKLLFFKGIKEAGLDKLIPRFWTSASDIPADAYPVVCRTVLAGHSGEGIVIADNPEQLVPAPLYVQYVKKKHEFFPIWMRNSCFFFTY